MSQTISRRDTFKLALPLIAAQAAAHPTFAQGADGRRAVVYLSRSGNTRVLAGALARRFGADSFELRPRDPWPEDYEEMVDWASRIRDSDVALAETPDLSGHDTVFLGFPIWGTALPGVMASFLRGDDLAGKTVLPFITHGGYGQGSSMDTVRSLIPGAEIVRPFVLECDQERASLRALDAWLGEVEGAL